MLIFEAACRFAQFDLGEENRLGVVGELLMVSGEFLVARIDRAGLIVAANSALCRRRGAESGELLGTALQYLVNAGERGAFAALVYGGYSRGRRAERWWPVC